jgi:hypothetical protein
MPKANLSFISETINRISIKFGIGSYITCSWSDFVSACIGPIDCTGFVFFVPYLATLSLVRTVRPHSRNKNAAVSILKDSLSVQRGWYP